MRISKSATHPGSPRSIWTTGNNTSPCTIPVPQLHTLFTTHHTCLLTTSLFLPSTCTKKESRRMVTHDIQRSRSVPNMVGCTNRSRPRVTQVPCRCHLSGLQSCIFHPPLPRRNIGYSPKPLEWRTIRRQLSRSSHDCYPDFSTSVGSFRLHIISPNLPERFEPIPESSFT